MNRRALSSGWTFPWVLSAALIAAVGIVFRVVDFARRDFWLDEQEQLRALSLGGVKELFEYLLNIPGGFPGDYLLTYPLGQFSHNKWVLSIPHFATMLMTFFFACFIYASFFPGRVGALVSLSVLAFNPALVFHSLEFRPYGTLSALALLSFWIIAVLARKSRYGVVPARWRIAGFSVAFLVSLFHAYGPLMWGSAAVFFLLTGGFRNDVRAVLRFASPVVLGGLAALPSYLYLAMRVSRPFGIDTFEYIPASLDGLKSVVLILTGARAFYPLVALSVVAVFIPPDRVQRLAFALVMVALPVFLILLSDIRQQYWFVPRQFVWTMPFWAIFLGWNVQVLLDAWMRRSGSREGRSAAG